jgi:hypothetical protein
MRLFVNDPLWDARVKIGVGFELKDDVENIHEEQHLHNMRIIDIYADQAMLTTLVPRLTFRVFLSADALFDQDAWNAV